MLKQTFPIVFGRNLISEIKNFVHQPFLLVTMENIWKWLEPLLEGCSYQLYFVGSTEQEKLEDDFSKFSNFKAIVGIGGGQAIDVAKYFTWKSGKPFFQFPTILSVDAMFGERSAVRKKGMVVYQGWARPESIFFDYDIILSAPKVLNYSGVGDVLCFLTGVMDWKYAHQQNKIPKKWSYREELAKVSLEKANRVLEHGSDIKNLTEKGIGLIVDGFHWGGTSFFTSGWCPCHIEGIEHFFFYHLEYLTGKKFVHGLPVCLGVYLGAKLHGQRSEEILDFLVKIGLDIRPQAMEVTWEDVRKAIKGLHEFVKQQNLSYGIAHRGVIGDEFIDDLQKTIIEKYQTMED